MALWGSQKISFQAPWQARPLRQTLDIAACLNMASRSRYVSVTLLVYTAYSIYQIPSLILDSTEADLAPLSFNKLSLKFIFISSIHQNKIEAF